MRWPALLGVLVSGLALILLALLIDIDALIKTLREARPAYLLVGVLFVYPAAMVARGYRWWLLLNKDPGFWRSFHIINVGYLANMIFPARLGEIARIGLVANEADAGKGVSAVAVERLVDLLFALMVVALGLVLLGDEADLPAEVTTSLGIFTGITALGLVVLFFTPPLHPLIVRLVRQISGRFVPNLQVTLVSFVERTLYNMKSLAHPLKFATIAGWTALTWVIYTSFYYILFLAFESNVPVGVGILVNGFIALSIGAPSVPSAAGPFHLGAALALSLYGYADELAASYAVVAHALVTGLTIAVGAWSLNRLGTSLSGLRQMLRRRSGELNA